MSEKKDEFNPLNPLDWVFLAVGLVVGAIGLIIYVFFKGAKQVHSEMTKEETPVAKPQAQEAKHATVTASSEEDIVMDFNESLDAFTQPHEDKAFWLSKTGGEKTVYQVKCPCCWELVNVKSPLNKWYCSNMHAFTLGFTPTFGPSEAMMNVRYDGLLSLGIMFETLGYLAKSDGQVTDEELESSMEIMSVFLEGIDLPEIRVKLKHSFRLGKKEFEAGDTSSLKQKMKIFKAINHSFPGTMRGFVAGLISTAFADGHLNANERRIIEDVNNILGAFSKEELRSSFEPFHGSSTQITIEKAFVVFGAKPGDSREVLKKRYRDLCRTHHPDSVTSKGGTEESRKVAESRMKEINGAWEVILSYLDSRQQAA